MGDVIEGLFPECGGDRIFDIAGQQGDEASAGGGADQMFFLAFANLIMLRWLQLLAGLP